VFIKAKKSLGQNFLIDREVLEKIVSITDITNKEVLEIGPGSGNLTTYILKKKPKKFINFRRKRFRDILNSQKQ
jgi:16S rRNA (adenine1518-N6/adenine1519-N6)-dimethyltransferase